MEQIEKLLVRGSAGEYNSPGTLNKSKEWLIIVANEMKAAAQEPIFASDFKYAQAVCKLFSHVIFI